MAGAAISASQKAAARKDEMSDKPTMPFEEVIARTGKYPPAAFEFVLIGLRHTSEKSHGPLSSEQEEEGEEGQDRHVSGQELCFGIRDLAIQRWGRLALAVLKHWNIDRTEDFGNIIFAMVNARHMRKKPEDRIEDFKDVYDFAEEFEVNYQIESSSDD
jgi:uncharacterized repeat protein (TIGR04138 family)